MIAPIDLSVWPSEDEHACLTHTLVCSVATRLRSRLGAEPTVDQVATVLGCPPGAVLAVLAATSAECLEEGSRPRPAHAD